MDSIISHMTYCYWDSLGMDLAVDPEDDTCIPNARGNTH
uniref:Uncharacterized protein n=1 Tax=Rhizophora mucronata TaxID=61149 RepID=A0A2P2IYW3_RHIMU